MTGIIPLTGNQIPLLDDVDLDTVADDPFLYMYIQEYQAMLDWLNGESDALSEMMTDYLEKFSVVPMHEMLLRLAAQLMLTVGYSRREILDEMDTAIDGEDVGSFN